jgi:monofunctional biosynthetic peptidoglycan transglycosylase
MRINFIECRVRGMRLIRLARLDGPSLLLIHRLVTSIIVAQKSPSLLSRRPVLSRLLLALLALLIVPYLLTPLYLSLHPWSTLMLWRWITGARVERVWLPLDRISPALPLAVLVAEDARFCSHRGVDWNQLRESVDQAEDLADVRGASTITQQTAKNLFLWPGRSVIRKVLEFPLTLWIDLVLPKRRILEIYLNIAEWGPDGEFGAETAAQRAFHKSARDLARHEAAVLAAVLPNPVRRNAQQPGPAVRRLAGIHEARAARAGEIDACVRPRR